MNAIVKLTSFIKPCQQFAVAAVMSFTALAHAAPPALTVTEDEVKFVLTPDTGNAETNDTLTVENSMTLQFSCRKRSIGTLKLVIPRDGFARGFHESTLGIASLNFSLDGGADVYVAAVTTNSAHTATIPSPQATLSIWFNHDKLTVKYKLGNNTKPVERVANYDLKSMRALRNGVRSQCWSLPT
jgi:hypothetical protein